MSRILLRGTLPASPVSDNNLMKPIVVHMKKRPVAAIRPTTAGNGYKKSAIEMLRQQWLLEEMPPSVGLYECLFTVYYDVRKVFTKSWPDCKSPIRVIDVGNTIKLLADVVKEVSGIDDSCFFLLPSRKEIVETEEEERVEVRIRQLDWFWVSKWKSVLLKHNPSVWNWIEELYGEGD